MIKDKMTIPFDSGYLHLYERVPVSEKITEVGGQK